LPGFSKAGRREDSEGEKLRWAVVGPEAERSSVPSCWPPRQHHDGPAAFRPAARSKSIKGLYLAGNSTHPGGGVPVVIGSGIICANLIDKYE